MTDQEGLSNCYIGLEASASMLDARTEMYMHWFAILLHKATVCLGTPGTFGTVGTLEAFGTLGCPAQPPKLSEALKFGIRAQVRHCLRSRSVLGEGEKWRPRAGVGDFPDGEHARCSSLCAEHQAIQSRATWIATCMLSRLAARRRCYRFQQNWVAGNQCRFQLNAL